MTAKKKGEQSSETYLQFFLQNIINCSVCEWTMPMLRLWMNYANFTFLIEEDYYSGQSKLWIHHSTLQHLPCWYAAVIFLHIIIYLPSLSHHCQPSTSKFYFIAVFTSKKVSFLKRPFKDFSYSWRRRTVKNLHLSVGYIIF